MNSDHTGKYYASDNPERYFHGPFETVAEAIAEFKSENEGEEPTVIGRATATYVQVDGERVIEESVDSMELYEDALDSWCVGISPEHYEELSKRLTKVVHDWLDEMGEPKCWNMIEQLGTYGRKN